MRRYGSPAGNSFRRLVVLVKTHLLSSSCFVRFLQYGDIAEQLPFRKMSIKWILFGLDYDYLRGA